MNRARALIEPTTTNRILANLGFAIDEAKIVRSIVEYSDHLRKIKYVPEASKRAQFIRDEIVRLETKLSQTRNRATTL
jgi:hypothetical protein